MKPSRFASRWSLGLVGLMTIGVVAAAYGSGGCRAGDGEPSPEASPSSPEEPVQAALDLVVDGEWRPGATVTLRVSAVALRDLDESFALGVDLADGIEFLSGSEVAPGSLARGERRDLEVEITLPDNGEYSETVVFASGGLAADEEYEEAGISELLVLNPDGPRVARNHGGYLDEDLLVELVADGPIAEGVERNLSLEVELAASAEAMGDLWLMIELPAGSELTSGALTSGPFSLQPGESASLEATVVPASTGGEIEILGGGYFGEPGTAGFQGGVVVALGVAP